MANRDLTPQESTALELLVDSTNVQAVLMALSAICGEKAEHVQANYSDPVTARAWRSAEGAIGIVATDRHVTEVSR